MESAWSFGTGGCVLGVGSCVSYIHMHFGTTLRHLLRDLSAPPTGSGRSVAVGFCLRVCSLALSFELCPRLCECQCQDINYPVCFGPCPPGLSVQWPPCLIDTRGCRCCELGVWRRPSAFVELSHMPGPTAMPLLLTCCGFCLAL